MSEITDSLIREILQGAYDLHAHPLPSHFKRCQDDFEFVRGCDEYGMGGIMLKSHYDPTPGRAMICNRYSGAKAQAYGGVALNQPVGGLNHYQAECALKLGGIIVWLPTRDASYIMQRGGKVTDFLQRTPIDVLTPDGKPVPAIYEIFETVKKYNAYLGTGHISPAESMVICTEGRKCGVNMILTHPDSKTTGMNLQNQISLANQGVLIEKVWDNILNGYITPDEMAHRIRAIGADRCFMSTDNGQIGKPPAQGMYDFVKAMLAQGISKEDLITMVRINPKRIIDARALAGI